MSNTSAPQTVIAVPVKSVGVSLLLTFFFGPLGMLYSTVVGAIIMIVISVILFLVTFGFSVFITWPVSMIWGAIAASMHNNKVRAGRF